jgi:hypothetical protein
MEETVAIRNLRFRHMVRQLEAAKYLYAHGLVPVGKEQKLLNIIALYEDLVSKEF